MVKFNFLYFKNLLDIAFAEYCNNFNDSFQKNDMNQYILSKNFSEAKMMSEFKKSINKLLLTHIVDYDRFNPTYYLIIGACFPKDNLLLNYKKQDYFPAKLGKIINADFQIKYVLKEKDIKIDLIQFNNICNKLFNHFFMQKHVKLAKNIERKNIFFIQHKNLDCYATFKLLKQHFGKSNCINMHEEKFKDTMSPIVAINDLIDRYVNKNCLNSSNQMKLASKELVQYINERIASI